jgi:hypothetical protein
MNFKYKIIPSFLNSLVEVYHEEFPENKKKLKVPGFLFFCEKATGKCGKNIPLLSTLVKIEFNIDFDHEINMIEDE